VQEVLVRGEGPLRLAALVQRGGGGDRSRLGFAVRGPGGRLHAGALRDGPFLLAPPAAGSLFRFSWPAPPAVSVAGTAEGLAWVGHAGGIAWVRRPGEAAAVSGWIELPRLRIAARSGPAAAGRLDARGPGGSHLALHADSGGPAGVLALVAAGGAVGVGYQGGWDARVGLAGGLARGLLRAEGVVARSDPVRSDVRAEWVRRGGSGELRLSARVNREEAVVRTAGRIVWEIRIARGAVGSVAGGRELSGRGAAAAGLEIGRGRFRLLARASLPERTGRRLDLRAALAAGAVRARVRLRLEVRRRPEAEVALTRRFALTSAGGRDTMRRFAEARD
jgi:hypothetical protein